MQTDTIVDSRIQTQAPQTWDKPTAQARVGDYMNEPFQPIMVIVDKDLLPDSKIWLLVKPVSGSCTQEWIIEAEPAVQSEPSCIELKNTQTQQEPVDLDYARCELQPYWSAMEEYEKGTSHGKYDAAVGLKQICTEASCPFSRGYLDAYHSFTQERQQFKQPLETKKPIEWRVVFAPDWDYDWYRVWVGGECRGKYSTYEEAERAAQKYIAADLARREHRELVLATYADSR